MGMFDGIDKVSSTQGGDYLKPGKHVLKIRALKQPPNLRSGDCFIAELEVVESSREDYFPGKGVSWVCNVTKHKEMALGNIKAFLAAVAGIGEEDVDKNGANAAVSEDQPFAGHVVHCEAFNKPTKAGGDFTRTIWNTADAA